MKHTPAAHSRGKTCSSNEYFVSLTLQVSRCNLELTGFVFADLQTFSGFEIVC